MKPTQFKQVLRQVVKEAVKEALDEFLHEPAPVPSISSINTTQVGYSQNEKVRVPTNSVESLLEETRRGLTRDEIQSIASFDTSDVLGSMRESLKHPLTIGETTYPGTVSKGAESMIPGLDMGKILKTVKKAEQLSKERNGGL